MSRNKATVERYLDGFRTSDHAKVLSCLTDDVEWFVPGAYHLRGKDAYDAEIENDAFVGQPTIEITRMIEEDDVVMAYGTLRVERATGGFFDAESCEVFVMEDSRIRERRSYVVEV